MSLLGDLLEGTLLYDAQGHAHVQPLLRRGDTLRVPPGLSYVIGEFSTLLVRFGAAGATVSALLLEPWAGAMVMGAFLAGHPVGVWWLSRRLQRAAPRDLGTRAERLLRLAHSRGEARIVGKLTWAALLLAAALGLFGWGHVLPGLVAALFGAAMAVRNLALLRSLRAGAQTQTRVPSGGNAGRGGSAPRGRKRQRTRRRPRARR